MRVLLQKSTKILYFIGERPKYEMISEISIKNDRSGRTLRNNGSGGIDGKGGEIESNYP